MIIRILSAGEPKTMGGKLAIEQWSIVVPF